ncbi:MAG: PAS domain S-box protein, partial [Cyanobacteria bacterium P01_D01_bin.115]
RIDGETAALQIPIGLLTERDLVQFQALGLALDQHHAGAFMSNPVFAVKSGDSLWHAQELMERHFIRRVVVTGDHAELLGIVTQSNLLQVLNPLELYHLTGVLEAQVETLEAEKIALLESQATVLEAQVRARTAHLQAQAEQNRLVADLALQIRSSLNLSVILQTTVDRIQAILGCDRVTIWQFDADWINTVVAEATTSEVSLLGARVQDSCLQSGTGQLAAAFGQGQIRIVPDIHAVEMSDCHRELLMRLHTRAKVLVPLLCDGELWGLLQASESQQARDWQPHEVELLQSLANHLAIAIDQATTHEKLAAELQLRRETEARLSESEQRYAALTDAVPVAILRSDQAGHIIFLNERWSQLSGLTVEASLGKGWIAALHPEDRDWVVAKTQAYVLQGVAFQHEYRLLRPDGQVVWVYEQTEVEHNADGQMMGHIGTLTDISDRKEAELALHQSEAKYSAVVDALPDLVIRMSREGVCLDFFATDNYKFLGNPQDYVGAHVADFFSPDLSQRRLQAAQTAIDTQSVQVYEQTLVNEGQLQIEEVRVVPYTDDEVVLIIRDITQRHQTEMALRELEQENQAILAAMPDLIIVLDANETLMRYSYNAELSEIVPIHPQPLGLSLRELLPPQEAGRFSVAVKRVLQTGQVEVFEQQLQFDDGLHYEEVRVVPYRNNQVLGMIRDITHRKQAELAIQNLIEGTAATGSDFFPSLVIHITQALGVPYGLVSELRDGELHVLAFAVNGTLKPAFSYSPSPTPCEFTLRDGRFYVESSVQEKFPEDPDLLEINADSYLGIAIPNSQGQAIGTLCILDTQPIQQIQRAEEILRVFAARASAELERLQAQLALEQLNAELEQRVEQRTQELASSEQDLRTVFDNVYEAILIHDFDGTILDMNDRCLEMLGATREQILAASISDFAAPDAPVEQIPELIQRVWAGEEVRLEWRDQRFDDGRIIDLDLSLRKVTLGNRPVIIASARDISDRKAAEQQLQILSTRLKLAIKSAQIGIWDWHESDRLSWDQRMFEIYDVQPEAFNVTYRDWATLVHPDDLAQYEAGIRDRTENHENENAQELRIIRPDGEIRHVLTTALIERDAQGNAIRIVGTNIDITDRKQAELQLQALNKRYELVLESSQAGLVFWNIVEDTAELSRRFVQMLGSDDTQHPELSSFTGFAKRIHPEDLPQVQAALQAHFERQEKCSIEYRVRHLAGHFVWIWASGQAIWDEAGRPVQMFIAVQEISDRKAAELRLRELNRRNELVFEGSQAGLIFWDIENDQGELSPKCIDILGYNAASYGEFKQRIHPEDIARAEAALKTHFEDQLPYNIEYRYQHPAGHDIWLYVCGQAIWDKAGHPTYMGMSVQDISDRKQAEALLRQRSEALARSEQDLRTIFNNVYDGVMIHDWDGSILDVNNRYLEILGATREQVMAASFADFTAPGVSAEQITDILRQVADGQHLRFEWPVQRLNDGTPWYADVSLKNVVLGNRSVIIASTRDVTDRKTAEQALQDSQARFRRMTDNVPGMIHRYVLHADGSDELTYVDSQIRDIFELEPKAVLQDATLIWARVHPDDVPRVAAAVQESAVTLQPFTSEHRLQLPKKGLRWVQIFSRPERLANGDVAWDGLVLDISDRKASEVELQRLSDRLELALASAEIGIWEWNFQTEELSWDDRMLVIHGVRREAFWGTFQDWADRVHPADFAQASIDLSDSNDHFVKEFRIIRPDGAIRHMFSAALRQRDEQGQPTRIVGVNLDISDRKAAIEQIRASEQRYASLAAAAPVGIFRTDALGNGTYLSDTWCAIAGLTQAEALGKGWKAALHPDDHDKVAAEWDQSLQDHRPAQIECRFQRPDGTIIWVYEQSVAEYNAAGEIIGCVGTITDITAQKAAEAQLEQTNVELLRATRLKDEFLANMSHEIRTPMNAILGMTELALGTTLTIQQRNYLNKIETSAGLLLHIINDILDFSKIEAGKLTLETTAFSLDAVLSNLHSVSSLEAQRKGLEFTFEIDADTPRQLVGDPLRLGQVLLNLVSNAIKFTEQGSVVIRIRAVTATAKACTLHFSVTDTGLGISPQQKARLFQAFSQGDTSTTRRFGGTGLGLIISQRLVQLMQGEIG